MASTPAERRVIPLNGFWSFRFQDAVPLERADDPHGTLDNVMCVPGSFDILPEQYRRRGTGLYRRAFTLDAPCPQGLLRLGGLGLRGRLWLDGRELGLVELPYSGVELETGPLAAGPHTLAAAIDNSFDAERMPLFHPGYDFYAFGGLYRDVELHALAADWWIERVQVRTLDYRDGTVSATIRLAGAVPDRFRGTLRFDAQDAPEPVDVPVREGRAQLTLTVPSFRPWSPEDPHLHTLTVACSVDTARETFGVRQVAVGRKTLLLNGRPLYLKGFNRHESHPAAGACASETTMLADLQHLKALGANFVRGAHYPQSQRFLELCDRTGFLVWEESLGWGDTPERLADPRFAELQERQTRLMVRNSVNHPSVILWAFLNEFHSQTPEGRALCRRLVKAIKEEDDSRPVTFACCHTDDDICHDLVDVVAFNAYPGWIDANRDRDPLEAIGPELARIIRYFRGRIPADKPIMIGEIGTCALYGERDEAAAQWTEEFQAGYLDEALRWVLASEELCGVTIWQMNDAPSYLRRGADIRCKPLATNLAGVYDAHRRAKSATRIVAKRFGGQGDAPHDRA